MIVENLVVYPLVSQIGILHYLKCIPVYLHKMLIHSYSIGCKSSVDVHVQIFKRDECLSLRLRVNRSLRVRARVWVARSLTFLAAVGFIVFDHEFFKLAQQLHGLLPGKRQTDTRNQHRPCPLSQVQTDSSGLHKRLITT